MEHDNMTGIFYTSNWLDDKNPYFLNNVKKQIVKAINGRPLIAVSQKPVKRFEGYEGEFTNINLGDIGRSHFNIYWQILQGCKAAKTKYVCMIEDDILYSPQHFNFSYFVKQEFIDNDYFLYDQNRVSIFTWSKPPMFSLRFKRFVVNQLIAKREMLIAAMEERFKKLEELRKAGWTDKHIEKFWGDPGKYEGNLGVTINKVYEYNSWVPSIVFSHELAYGFAFNQGKKKKLGDLRFTKLADWNELTAEDALRFFYPEGKKFPYGL
jgi:hypothetical protein